MVTLGQTATRILTIQNVGDSVLAVHSISYPVGFSGNWSGGTIAPGAGQNVTVTFAPTAAQSYAGTIVVSSDATGGTNIQTVSGTGQAHPSDMVLIPAGSFTMGDTFNEGYSGERPAHTVYVSAFHMDRHEVTKALWDEVYQWAISHGYGFDNPGAGKAANHPVHTVSWFDVVKWCNARSEREGRTAAYYTDTALTVVYRIGQAAPYVKWNLGYRLPTEAEWEKAARGGLSGLRFPWGDTITHSQANYESSSSYSYDISPTRGYHPSYDEGGYPYTSPVGSFAPNGYGLYYADGNLRSHRIEAGCFETGFNVGFVDGFVARFAGWE